MIIRLSRPVLIGLIGNVVGAREPFPQLHATRRELLHWIKRNAPNVLEKLKGENNAK